LNNRNEQTGERIRRRQHSFIFQQMDHAAKSAVIRTVSRGFREWKARAPAEHALGLGDGMCGIGDALTANFADTAFNGFD